MAIPHIPIMKDPMSVAPATQLISTVVEEEEDIAMPTKELDKYFFFSSVDSTSSPISKHLEAVHEYLNGTFPTKPVALA